MRKLTRPDYDAIPALSNSGAKVLSQSPMAYVASLTAEKVSSPALRFGSLVHAVTLEPEEADTRYSFGPDASEVKTKDGKPASNPWATSEGKALLSQWGREHPGVELVTRAEWDQALAMAAAVKAHPRWVALLADAEQTWVECSTSWTDKATGCPCKMQADLVVRRKDGSVVVVDLKTTDAPLDAESIGKTIATFSYHRQAAWYLDGAAADPDVRGADEFWLAFVSKTAPHDVAIVRVGYRSLVKGAEQNEKLRRLYVACQESGQWPGAQGAGFVGDTVEMPEWALRGV